MLNLSVCRGSFELRCCDMIQSSWRKLPRQTEAEITISPAKIECLCLAGSVFFGPPNWVIAIFVKIFFMTETTKCNYLQCSVGNSLHIVSCNRCTLGVCLIPQGWARYAELGSLEYSVFRFSLYIALLCRDVWSFFVSLKAVIRHMFFFDWMNLLFEESFSSVRSYAEFIITTSQLCKAF